MYICIYIYIYIYIYTNESRKTGKKVREDTKIGRMRSLHVYVQKA